MRTYFKLPIQLGETQEKIVSYIFHFTSKKIENMDSLKREETVKDVFVNKEQRELGRLKLNVPDILR